MGDQAPTLVGDAADVLAVAIASARALTSRPDIAPDTSTTHRAPSTRPPWNAAAANAYLDAHEGIRRLEAALRDRVTGSPGPRRGGTDANTWAALDAIVNLAEAIDPKDARRVARILYRWAAASERLIAVDTRATWRPIRAQPGAAAPACPYCSTWSLRVAERSGVVACFYPQCADSDGARPFARLDWSVITGDPVITWADGLVQGAADARDEPAAEPA